jgi:Na+-driven multidrug efflux pump
MKREKDTSRWTPDKKISWAASLLTVVLTNFFVIFLTSIGTFDLEGGTFWVGMAIGCALAAALNWLRPRYDHAGRFWKPIYRFLLEQMPPPD